MKKSLLLVTALMLLFLVQVGVASACSGNARVARVTLSDGGTIARIDLAANPNGPFLIAAANIYVRSGNVAVINFMLLALHRGWQIYFETTASDCPESGSAGTVTLAEN